MIRLLLAISTAQSYEPTSDFIGVADDFVYPFGSFEGVVYAGLGQDLMGFDTDTKERSLFLHKDGPFGVLFVGDLGRLGSGVFCGDTLPDLSSFTMDCFTRQTVFPDDHIYGVANVAGDGIKDLFGYAKRTLHMDRGDHYETYALPSVLDAPYRSLPVGDIDGDGADDLLLMTFTEAVPLGYVTLYESSRLELRRGTSDGYSNVATWSIDLTGPLETLIDVQLDDDPEREIVLVIGDQLSNASYTLTFLQVATIDPSGGEPELWVSEERWTTQGTSADRAAVTLHPIGDVDQDGVDDVLFSGAPAVDEDDDGVFEWSETVPLRVLTASNGWRVREPLLTLRHGAADEPFDNLRVITADVNGDGRLDVVAGRRSVEPTGSATFPPPLYPGYLQVWYAPWLEADPKDTGPTTTTSSTSVTGQTADTASLAISPQTVIEQEPSCGCSTGTSSFHFPLAARRRGHVK